LAEQLNSQQSDPAHGPGSSSLEEQHFAYTDQEIQQLEHEVFKENESLKKMKELIDQMISECQDFILKNYQQILTIDEYYRMPVDILKIINQSVV